MSVPDAPIRPHCNGTPPGHPKPTFHPAPHILTPPDHQNKIWEAKEEVAPPKPPDPSLYNWSLGTLSTGRKFYLDHSTQTSSWVPPQENWNCLFGLPYGWELAVDTTGKPYYINHKEQLATYLDPRQDEDFLVIPEPREVLILRDSQLGYGFVAGSEKPVVIRFVTDGGPSTDQLLPGDQILAVNGEDVSEASKDHVVTLVRNSPNSVTLTVCQPRSNDSSLKSSMLSAAKKARLRHTPSRVRFAEGVQLSTPPGTPSGSESCVPFMPNVLRVFLENGQTKSFKYDQTTTVKEVLESLKEKLALSRLQHFALMLEHPQGPRSHKLTLLMPHDRLTRIAARPGSQHFRCLFRIAFVPLDPLELQRNDPIAFEYYYQQCVNDVVAGRYAYEMRYEACLRLAALQIQQVAHDTHSLRPHGKVSLKAIEKEYGLSKFLPMILLENVKRKEIRKHLRYYLKRDYNRQGGVPLLPPPLNNNNPNINERSVQGDVTSSVAQTIKIKYVHMLSHLPSFGGRSFYVTFKDTNTDMLMDIHPRTGIVVRNTGRASEPTLSLHFDMLSGLELVSQSEVVKLLTMHLCGDTPQLLQALDFFVDRDDGDDMVLYIQGYYFLIAEAPLPVHLEGEDFDDPPVPPYLGLHSVRAAGWNYAVKDGPGGGDRRGSETDGEHLVDFARGPPIYSDAKISENVRVLPSKTWSRSRVGNGPSSIPSATPDPSIAIVEVHRNHTQLPSPNPLDKNIGDALPESTHAPVVFQISNESNTLSQPDSDPTPPSNPPPPPLPPSHDPSKENAEKEEEEEDEFISSRVQATLAEIERRNQSTSSFHEDGSKPGEVFVRKTFLRAKDSMLILNKANKPSPAVPGEEKLPPVKTVADSSEKDPLSSSDTESLSTPSESPIHRVVKTRPNKLDAGRVRSAEWTGSSKNPSFGLQSPDTLPCSVLSDADLQGLLTSSGLEGQQLEDLLLLFPDNFCMDAEIIDLTLLPPPPTPENVRPVDLAVAEAAVSSINPPTPFRDDVEPRKEFENAEAVMQRLGVGDVRVIEDSHQKAYKSCKEGRRKSSRGITPDLVRAGPTLSSSSSPSKRAKEELKDSLPGITTSDLKFRSGSGSGGAAALGVVHKDYAYPSIDDPVAFEEFLSQSIIPPPPSSSPPSSSIPNNPKQIFEEERQRRRFFDSLRRGNESKKVLQNESPKKVRFSPTAIVRQRSNSGGLERILTKSRLKEKITEEKIYLLSSRNKKSDSDHSPNWIVNRLIESHSFPTGKASQMDHIRRILKAEKTLRHNQSDHEHSSTPSSHPEPHSDKLLTRTQTLPAKKRMSMDKAATGRRYPTPDVSRRLSAGPEHIYMGGPEAERSTDMDELGDLTEVQKVDLGHFSGLEGSDRSPQVTKVNLRNFDGLEGLAKGVASVSLEEAQINSPDKHKRGFFARIRSVDPHIDSSPESSPIKHKNKTNQQSPARGPNSTGRNGSLGLTAIQEQAMPYGATGLSETSGEDPDMVRKMDLSDFTGLEQTPSSEGPVLRSPEEGPHATAEGKTASHQSHSSSVSAASSSTPVDLLANCSARRRSLSSAGSSQAQPQEEQDENSQTSDSELLNSAPYLPVCGNGTVPLVTSESSGSGDILAGCSSPTDEDFALAREEIQELITKTKSSVDGLPTRSPRKTPLAQTGTSEHKKLQLLVESQQFAASSKILVRCASENTNGQLLSSLHRCVNRAHAVYQASVSLMRTGELPLFQGQILGAKVKEVLVAFEGTVAAIEVARGKPLSHPEMKRMMRQSTTLAATLTQLIRCVRDNAH